MEPQKEPNPNYLPYPPRSTNDEVDIRELFKVLWKGKWIIIVTTFVFAVASVLYALSLPNTYKADALLAPAENSNGGDLSKMAGQLGGFVALAGINLSAGNSSPTDLAVQVMKSRQFIEYFITKHDLLVPLMAVKDWNIASNKLILNEDIYSSATDTWLREAIGLRGAKPSAQEAFDVFSKDVFELSQGKESGLYTVSIIHYSPYIAKQWVNWLIDDINKVMRERAIEQTSQNLSYLNIQLEKTAVVDMQSAFYKLIEEQTKSLMLAEMQEEFVFKIIDPAVVPELKYGPKRFLILIVITIFGFILSISFLLVKEAWKEKKAIK